VTLGGTMGPYWAEVKLGMLGSPHTAQYGSSTSTRGREMGTSADSAVCQRACEGGTEERDC
jgi:hypothetical protein